MTRSRIWDVVCLNVQSNFFIFLGIAFFPLQEAIARDLNLSDNQIGAIQGPITNFGIVILSIPLGILVDRYSRTTALRYNFAVALAAALLTVIADGFFVLAAARAVASLCVTAAWIANLSLLADLYPPEKRGRGFTIFALVGCFPAALSFAVVSALVDAFGDTAGMWRPALACAILIALPVGAACFLIAEPQRSEIDPQPASRAPIQALRTYGAILLVLIAARATLMIADGAATTWAAPMYAREFGLTAGQVGSVMAPILFASSILGVSANWFLTDTHRAKAGARLMVGFAGTAALISVPFAAFPSIGHLPLSAFSLLVFLSLGNLVGLMAVVLTALTIPSDLRGTALGILQTGGYLLGAMPAPVAVSYLATTWGGRDQLGAALSAVCVVASLACAVALIVGVRWFPGAAARQSEA